MAQLSDTNSGPHRLDLTGRRILVVEDDRMNARIISSILRPGGFVTQEADSGEAALALYKEFQPDLILLDVVMSGINGFETCRRLKTDPAAASIPVIFITAKNQPDDIVAGLEAGGVDYVVKPFQPREMLARIRTHLQLRTLLEHQTHLIDDLSKANAAKNHFLGIAAHDLRNPLTSIRGLSEFMLEGSAGELSEDQRAMLRSVYSATQAMLELLGELLDISVIESGEMRLDLTPTNFADIVHDAVFLNGITAARKQMKIACRPFKPSRPLLIDARKIREVIDNLLSNAIKFSAPGTTITVELSEDGNQQTISVQDQGPGIPLDEMNMLFQSFGKTSVRPTGGEKSTGLGLAICRKIVEAHHGTVSAANRDTGGADFRVTLPAPDHGV
ncbi:MAG: hybrid sensor histidine kinase/response regulator [Opitutaceae bacterium]|nr:hybrid sensor histidine kinase/response regulator [Opitutaceae bacterium]